MKKLFFLLIVICFLIGCQQEQIPLVTEEIMKEALTAEKITSTQPSVFGISVDGIANGAIVNEMPMVISGQVSANAEAVNVNGAPVQNYMTGSGEWSYFASSDSNNFLIGENIFEITAIGPNNISATVLLAINFDPLE